MCVGKEGVTLGSGGASRAPDRSVCASGLDVAPGGSVVAGWSGGV